jgi:enoyl-CoA hydratase
MSSRPTAVRVERTPPVAWVVLDRSDLGNPVDGDLAAALRDAWSALASDPDLRAIGIVSSGLAFSVGRRPGDEQVVEPFGPKTCGCLLPVVVALAGDVGAAAFPLIGEADVVLASPDVRFTMPLDRTHDDDVLHLQTRLPHPELTRLALVGVVVPLTAMRASQLGLVDELVEAPKLRARAVELLARLAGVPPHP